MGVEEMTRSSVRINAGFFVFKREVIDLIGPGTISWWRPSRA